jgi:hypothetical protein
MGSTGKQTPERLPMTQLDDAVTAAGTYMKRAEDVLAAYRAMNAESRAKLQAWFPTLTTNLQMLAAAHKVFE